VKSASIDISRELGVGFEKFLHSFKRRAMVNAVKAWRDISTTTRLKITGEVQPGLKSKEEAAFILKQMRQCLDHKGGEVSARKKAAELGQTYLTLNESGKRKFMKILAEDFAIDDTKISEAVVMWQKSRSKRELHNSRKKLQAALQPDSLNILRQFTALPNGVKFLVDLRADLMDQQIGSATKDSSTDAPIDGLTELANDLRNLLAAWFDIGLLDMERISWDSPAALLEKLIAYEAVHEIKSWNDLKNRLDSDRRCFAFFHSKMPLEPLIFVEVALVNGIASNVQDLLDESKPVGDAKEADTAIFYSISNAQKGLSGISFGNFLIKRVVERLSESLPNIKTFATLSPMPGFAKWLNQSLKSEEVTLFTAQEIRYFKAYVGNRESVAVLIAEKLSRNWELEPKDFQAEFVKLITRLAAKYLQTKGADGKAIDAVANFHLSNGARIERINWLADSSPKGMKQSYGLMVNYLYKLSDIEDNHEHYTSKGTIAASRTVKAL
jgi:malonyl-CoA decarboxylase